MNRVANLIAVTTTLASIATACGFTPPTSTTSPSPPVAGVPPRGGPPAMGDWDGTNLTRCDNPTVPPPSMARAPAGFVHVLVVITADTLDDNGCRANIFLPFQFLLEGSVNGIPGVKLERGGEPLPWRAQLITPHFEHLFVRLATHGSFRVSATASHIADARPGYPVLFRCTIFVENRRVAWQFTGVQEGITTIRCNTPNISLS